VVHEPFQGAEQVRAAEVIGALCLATDLGMGFPFEHGLHSTLAATRLADRLGVDPATASQAYYACLLSHAGCTTDAHVTAEVFGDSLTTHLNPVLYGSQREVLTGLIRALPEAESPAPVRALQVARGFPRIVRVQRPHFTAMCEVAQMLADGVGLPSSIAGVLAHLTERWDGKGPLRRAKGEEIPLPMRIVHVAVDATFQRWLGGVERAARLASERAGGGLDPEVAACLAEDAEEILALDPEASAWDEVLACEPEPRLTLEGEAIDRALSAMGGFADLISPYLSGHSTGVAELAEQLRGASAELIDDGGVEVPAPSLTDDLHSRIDAVDPVEDLDDVAQVEQPHGQGDLLTAHPAWNTLAVPAGEDLLQRVPHLMAQAQPLGHAPGRQAVRHQHPFDGPAPGGDHRRPQAQPAQGGAAGSDVAEHEAEQRKSGQVDLVAVRPVGDVVAEPLGDVGRVGHAPDPRQQRHVVQGGALGLVEAQPVREAGGDRPGTQDMLHGLSEPQIGGQREGGHKVGQPDPRVAIRAVHPLSRGNLGICRVNSRRPRQCLSLWSSQTTRRALDES
jgi:hypothetical protein